MDSTYPNNANVLLEEECFSLYLLGLNKVETPYLFYSVCMHKRILNSWQYIHNIEM